MSIEESFGLEAHTHSNLTFPTTVRSLFLRNGFWQISPQRDVVASWGFQTFEYNCPIFPFLLSNAIIFLYISKMYMSCDLKDIRKTFQEVFGKK